MKCFYHSADLDGHCSGAIVKHRFPDCELIGINYGQPFPWDTIERDETVYMVDFSLQPFEDMVRLYDLARLHWLDHHKTAIESGKRIAKGWLGLRVEGIGACELTWQYLYPNCEMPEAVRLLGRYDVWDHKDPAVLPFQFGMRLYETDPAKDMSIWEQLLHPDPFPNYSIDGTLWKGEAVLAYQEQENRKYVAACAFETMLEKYRCIAVNKMLTNSQLFDAVWDPKRYEMMVAFGWRGNKWTVSLFSTRPDIDVSQIAKAYGGGGHKGAAGFQCTRLPFQGPEV